MEGSDDRSSLRDGHWSVQPSWVKALTIVIAVPALLVLVLSVFTGKIDNIVEGLAFGAFAAIALLQLIFVFRAFWRMDL